MIESKGQPKNINFLSASGFHFTILELPHVDYFCQSCNIPGLNLGVAEEYTPFAKIPWQGDLVFEDLMISFKVDEDLKNYLEVWNWIVGLGFPYEHKQYRDLLNSNQKIRPGIGDTKKTGSLLIYTNKNNFHHEITYYDLFPVNLSGLSFQTTDNDVNYLTATATFKYTIYTIRTYNL